MAAAALKPLVFTGPSGCGKSTLIERLKAAFPKSFGFSVSHTTRQPRAGEVHGREYFFVDRHTMEQMIAASEFIEYTNFSANIYGTSKSSMQTVLEDGKICILDLDIDGIKSLKKMNLDAHYISIVPPSIDVLENRLRGRASETEEMIAARLERAHKDLDFFRDAAIFDLVVENDVIDSAYQQLYDFVKPVIDASESAT